MSVRDKSSPMERSLEDGFTLVELLVALTLLGVLTVLLSSSLHFGARAWDRSSAHRDQADSVELAQQLLRRAIGSAYPMLLTQDAASPHIDFDGEPHRMSFLAPAPAPLGGSGLARYTLTAAVASDGPKLLSIAASLDLANPDESGSGLEEVLVRGFGSVEFSYFGAAEPGGAAQWLPAWHGRSELPQLVRARISFPRGDIRIWPELVIQPRITADVSCVYDPLTKRCRGR